MSLRDKPYYHVNVDFPTTTARIHSWQCNMIPSKAKRPQDGHWRGFGSYRQAYNYGHSLRRIRKVVACRVCLS